MKRRRIVFGLLALSAGPFTPTIQAQAPKRIGVVQFRGGLMNRDMPGGVAFVAAMKELGYREGADYIFDNRQWERQEQVPELVRELVRLKTDVIVAASPPSIVGGRSVTDQIPIVMMYSAEPVAMGLVQSLRRPGGNLTGLAWDHGFETSLKALELLKETLPKLRRVALIWDGTDSVHPVYASYFAKAAPQVGLTLISVELKQVADLEPSFTRMRGEKIEALVVLPSGQITIPNRKAIMALASRDRIPTIWNTVDNRDYPDVLLRYGPNLSSMPRRAAAYVDRIFKGAKPADIPIEQPDKYDLVVDLRAARKLKVTIPHSVMVRADRVIE